MASPALPPELAALAAELPAYAEALQSAYAERIREREEATEFLTVMEARRAEAEEQEGEQLVGWELHEKLTGGRSTKVLEAWAQQRARWDKVKARLTSASGKPVVGLAMERGDEARRRVEALALVELATPLEERYGPLAWTLSLRDNWQMFVPMGHPVLSGLSGLRRLDVVQARGVAAVRRAETTAPPTARAARAAAAFERHTRVALRRRGAGGAVAGGAAAGVGALEVCGLGLEAHLRSLLTTPVTPDEVLRALSATSPEAAAALREARDAKAALAEALAAEEAAAAAPPPPPPPPPRGPALRVAPMVLSFKGVAPAEPEPEADAGDITNSSPNQQATIRGSRGVVTLSNTGSAALFYRFVLADTTGDAAAPPQFVPLPHPGPRPGVLLPGESRTAAFRYAPSHAGAVTELWAVQCAPDLARGPGEAVPMVMLQGTARAPRPAAAHAAEAAAPARPAGAQRAQTAVGGARGGGGADLAVRPGTAAARTESSDAQAERRRKIRAAAAAFDARMADAEQLLRAGALARKSKSAAAPGPRPRAGSGAAGAATSPERRRAATAASPERRRASPPRK